MRILRFKSLVVLLGLSLIVLVTASCQVPSTGLKDSLGKESIKTAVKEPANLKGKSKGKSRKKLSADQKVSSEMKDRKIIKKANLSLERKDLKGINKEVKELAKEYEGYIVNSHQWQSKDQQKHFRYTLRIPQQNFEAAMTKLKDLGKLKDEQLNGRDITREYINLEARLKNFKAQEERYLELLNQAKDVEDMLKIEKELNRVRGKIEQFQGRLKYYDNRVDLATINVNISQPPPVIKNNWQIINSFKEAIRGFVKSINLIIILIGTLLPWLFFVALIGMLGYIIFKAKRK
ncbi:DUF4349 domain-containing protein [Sporohalobacter salinus]|uniref:DUF4349 domain-containing protein n=1 Tax=Sporohalobacter salinus TaxID=1494606 RepID=UPI00195F3B6D|nr:DUF4349 domain-containing protein [Sporohalobacter salinus]MBM7622573.1 hypothetical protein [Sporohalobacter salinus]